MKGRIVLGVMGAGLALVAILLLTTAIGIPVEFALAWTFIAGVVVLATRQSFIDDAGAWPPEKPTLAARGSEVSRLAWAINPSTGAAGQIVVRRVDRVLRRRLTHHGLDLDDPEQYPAIDDVLGAGIRDLLAKRELKRQDLERLLDAIERIPSAAQQTTPRNQETPDGKR